MHVVEQKLQKTHLELGQHGLQNKSIYRKFESETGERLEPLFLHVILLLTESVCYTHTRQRSQQKDGGCFAVEVEVLFL